MLNKQDYNNFHRIDLHKELIKSAFEGPGEGPPCILKVNHRAVTMDPEAGTIAFENGTTASADLIVAADGIRVCHTVFCEALLMSTVSQSKLHWNNPQRPNVHVLLLPLHHQRPQTPRARSGRLHQQRGHRVLGRIWHQQDRHVAV